MSAYVIGVGMSRFEKPGKIPGWDYPAYGKIAVLHALRECGLAYTDVQQAYVGYCYGDSCQGQRVLYEVGMTGIPIFNVNNNCSTGSTAIFLARNAIISGQADCVIALGFEKMAPGSLGSHFPKQANPLEPLIQQTKHLTEFNPKAPFACQFFANAAKEHMTLYGSVPDDYACIAEKNHRHSSLNPYSQFRDVYSLEEIKSSPLVFGCMTKLQCCPTSDGAACAILVSKRFIERMTQRDERLGLELKALAVEILGQGIATDSAQTLNGSSLRDIAGYDMTKRATEDCIRQVKEKDMSFTSVVHDVGVAEVHDCFSANEMMAYESTGLAAEGRGHLDLVRNRQNQFGGRVVVNPSGGLISKGHPLGATGIAQCAELTWQLRGVAGPRQVKDRRSNGQAPLYALQHNIGLGGCAVVSIYRIGFPETIVKERLLVESRSAANDPDLGGIPEIVMNAVEAKSKNAKL